MPLKRFGFPVLSMCLVQVTLMKDAHSFLKFIHKHGHMITTKDLVRDLKTFYFEMFLFER